MTICSPIVRDVKLRLRNGEKIAPQSGHLIAVDAGGARQQLFGMQQVRSAHGMNVDLRALLCEPAGRAGMVEMDVGQQHVGDIGEREAIGC